MYLVVVVVMGGCGRTEGLPYFLSKFGNIFLGVIERERHPYCLTLRYIRMYFWYSIENFIIVVATQIIQKYKTEQHKQMQAKRTVSVYALWRWFVGVAGCV